MAGSMPSNLPTGSNPWAGGAIPTNSSTTADSNTPTPTDLPPNKQVNPVTFANSIGNLLSAISAGGDTGTSTGVGPLSADSTFSTVTSPADQNTQQAAVSATTPTTDVTGSQNPNSTGTVDPVPKGTAIAQGWGGPSGGHPGVDLSVPVGTTVVSAISGTVSVASGGQGGYGNLVEVTGANGIKTRYGHLSVIGIKAGDKVTAGQPIGKSGGAAGAPGAGNSTGPHLHFEVDLPGGGTADPMPYLAGGAQIVKDSSVPDLNSAAAVKPIDIRDAGDTAGNRLTGALTGQDPGSENQAQTTTTTTANGQTQTPAGSPDDIIRQAMRITGVPDDWFNSLHKIMMRESGGQNIAQQIHDVNTDKGTPAFGPMQIIEPTFNAHALPGYTDWHNPLDSTIAAIRYIQSRYGRPDNGPDGPGGY